MHTTIRSYQSKSMAVGSVGSGKQTLDRHPL